MTYEKNRNRSLKILRHWLQEGYEAEMLNGADQLPKEKESEADTEE